MDGMVHDGSQTPPMTVVGLGFVVGSSFRRRLAQARGVKPLLQAPGSGGRNCE